MTAFGEYLYSLRKQKGWTQKQLASQLGLSNKAVSKWETGEAYPDINQLYPLAALFGVSVDCLLRGGVSSSGRASFQETKHLPQLCSRNEWRKYSRKHATPKWKSVLKTLRICAAAFAAFVAALCICIDIFANEYILLAVTALIGASMISGGIFIISQLHNDCAFLPFGEGWQKIVLRHKLMVGFAYEIFLASLWFFYGTSIYTPEQVDIAIATVAIGLVMALLALTLFVSELVLWCRDREEFAQKAVWEEIE